MNAPRMLLALEQEPDQQVWDPEITFLRHYSVKLIKFYLKSFNLGAFYTSEMNVGNFFPNFHLFIIHITSH